MKTFTRREFLKTSVSAGIAIGATTPGLRASSYNRILGANNTIRIAVVGFNSKGAQHIEVFHNLEGVRVVALCDVDQNVLNRQAQEFKDRKEEVKTYKDVRSVLDDKDIDAVVVATPNHWHSLIGIWACQAEKDVYVEKPISHNIWEGRKLVEAARKYDRIVQAGTQNRSDVGFREAIAYLREGHLGKLLWARGVWYKMRESIGRVTEPQAIPDNIDYDLWTGPASLKPLMRPKLHYDWHWFWETGNGDMGNLGLHQIDDCRFAMELDGLPERVMSLGGRYAFDDDAETPNTQIAFFDYKPTPVMIEIRNLPTTKGRRAMDHLHGVRSGNILQCEHGYFAGGRYGGWVYDNDDKKIKQFPGDGGGTHQQNFIEAMRSRKHSDLRAEILAGHISSVLCHIANISYRLGKAMSQEEMREVIHPQAKDALESFAGHLAKNEVDFNKEPTICGPWLSLDEKTEAFAGDHSSSANQLRRRQEYRQPFVVPEQV